MNAPEPTALTVLEFIEAQEKARTLSRDEFRDWVRAKHVAAEEQFGGPWYLVYFDVLQTLETENLPYLGLDSWDHWIDVFVAHLTGAPWPPFFVDRIIEVYTHRGHPIPESVARSRASGARESG